VRLAGVEPADDLLRPPRARVLAADGRRVSVAAALGTLVVALAVRGEMAFMPWLLIRGVDVREWERQALAAGA
jgi:hypothetical protein